MKAIIAQTPTQEQRENALIMAKFGGFWSVWRAVFHDDPDMQKDLNDLFPGTAKDCFDPQTQVPIARPGGQL